MIEKPEKIWEFFLKTACVDGYRYGIHSEIRRFYAPNGLYRLFGVYFLAKTC